MPQSMDDSYEYIPNRNFENASKMHSNNSKKDKSKRNSSSKALQFDPTKMNKIHENVSTVSSSIRQQQRHSKMHDHEMKECTLKEKHKENSKHAKELEMSLYSKVIESHFKLEFNCFKLKETFARSRS